MRSEPIMDSDSIPLVAISPENPLCAKKKPVPAIQDDAAANDDSANLDDNKLIDAESESRNNLSPSGKEIGAKNDAIDRDENKLIDAESESQTNLTPSGKEIGPKNDTIDRDQSKPIERLDQPILMDPLALQILMVWEPSLTLTDT